MPIPFRPPEPSEDGWKTHDRELALSRGRACYAALAAHFGTESPKILETRVDQRDLYVTRHGERSQSGKFANWRDRGTLPGEDTVQRVFERTAKGLDLRNWRDLFLWKLLAKEPPSLDNLQSFLEKSPRCIRRVVFFDSEPNRLGRFTHGRLDRNQILLLRDQRSLDAFIALLCVARIGETLGDDPQHFLPTACAFDIYPRVLYRHAPLRFAWSTTFSCLERVFFRRHYGDGMYYEFPREQVEDSLKLLDANPRSALPELSGLRTPRPAPEPMPRVPKGAAKEMRKLAKFFGLDL